MFIMVSSEDENVVHVAEYPVMACKDCAHPTLKVLWSTADAKW